MNSKKQRTVSTSFAVFLNTFLIISTVIVFAVLLFLSYENMVNSTIEENVQQTTKTVSDVTEDYISTFAEIDPEESARLFDKYLHSKLLEDNGKIFIADEEGIILFSNQYYEGTHVVGSETRETIRQCSNNDNNTITERTDGGVLVMSCLKIPNTSMYCICINSADLDAVRAEFNSVILIPGLVAMLFAVALFIGFIGLTVRPFREISSTIAKVSEGDFSARIDKKYTSVSGSGSFTVSSDMADMARTVNQMIESLDNQEKDRNVFISSVAHDIRTPLTSINGFITAMLDGTISPDNQEKYLLMIKQEVDRIRKLIMSMTEASSLSHVDPELMEAFDIKDVVEDVTSNLEPQLNDKNITILTDVDTSAGTSVYGEAQQLCRVIVNIITNAIKFTPEGGTIKVSTWPDTKEGVMKIAVDDSGPGVEKEKRSRVFESFYKADPSRKQEGFGLGLYICKMILQGHGQTIILDESTELGGARFVFSFPRPPENK